MKREVRITLPKVTLAELVAEVVAKRQKLDPGYVCSFAMTADGEMVCCFSWPPKGDG